MSPENDQAIRWELGAGEWLLWSGAPIQGLRFRGSDLLMIPFSLLWAGFTVFWEYSVVHSNAPVFMVIWGIPFIVAGLYLVVGRFFLDSYLRGRTLYAITDQRALIVGGGFGHQVRSLPLRNLAEVNLKENGDGSGSIVLGGANPFNYMFAGTPWPGAGKRFAPSFDSIVDARKVYGVLQEAQRLASSPASSI
jgi:hypothetical protein